MAIKRNHAVFLGDVARNGGNDIVGKTHFSEIYKFDAKLSRFGLGDLGWREELFGNQSVHHSFAGRIGFLTDGPQLFLSHQPHVLHDLYAREHHGLRRVHDYPARLWETRGA